MLRERERERGGGNEEGRKKSKCTCCKTNKFEQSVFPEPLYTKSSRSLGDVNIKLAGFPMG